MDIMLKTILENNIEISSKGKVADYIPALKKANIDDCGITIIDSEKNIYSYGDYNKKFTIQSISKVVSLMLAIMDRGVESVFKTVGYQGTERLFNDIEYLGKENVEKAINPMINSGAIVVTSLVKGSGEEKFKRILELVKLLAKNPEIEYDREVYHSEKDTGDRNRAIAYLMKSKGIIQGDVDSIVNAYFKQCSIKVNTIDLANIGISIANRFTDIDLDASIDKVKLSRILINIMYGSGMYNFSGQWAAEVGIASKSGVAGGILSVIPKQYGIGFYGPSLDENGNSIVGYGVMKDLSDILDLKIF